jgi:hypothetical protein
MVARVPYNWLRVPDAAQHFMKIELGVSSVQFDPCKASFSELDHTELPDFS